MHVMEGIPRAAPAPRHAGSVFVTSQLPQHSQQCAAQLPNMHLARCRRPPQGADIPVHSPSLLLDPRVAEGCSRSHEPGALRSDIWNLALRPCRSLRRS